MPMGIGISVGLIGGGGAGGIPALNAYTPLFDFDARMVKGGGRYVQSLGLPAPTKNLIGMNTGKIVGAISLGSTATEFYAEGPQGGMTAKRLQIAATTGGYDFVNNTIVAPAGPYTFKCKVKSNAGQGTANFQYGVSAGGGGSLTAGSCDEEDWTTLTFSVVPNGTSDTPRLSLKNTGGSAIDILLDEVQYYDDEDTIPDFSEELVNVVALKSMVSYPGSFTKTGGAIDNTAGLIRGFIPHSTYPATKAMSELTMMGMVSTDDVAVIAAKLLAFNAVDADPAMGVSLGNAYGAPAFTRLLTNVSHRFSGLGYHVLTVRVKANEQSFWIDKFKHTVKAAASSPIPTVTAMLFGDDEAIIRHPFKGKITRVAAWDRWLTDQEVADTVDEVIANHIAMGETPPDVSDILIVEGDSIFANVEAAPNGPGWMAQYFATLPTGILGMNNAVSGSSLSHLTTRLTSTALTNRIQTAVANGYNVIVPVLIGANAIPTINDLITYWGALRTAGAKVIACTILPQDDGTFNGSRATRNSDIRSASASYDALVDFDLSEDIGQDANPPARVNYFDEKHLNAAGHAIALEMIQTEIDALRS